MKTLIPCLALATASIFLVSLAPEKTDAVAGKIQAALPEKAYAKPAKPRHLLVFSRTNGFRHASIPTGRMMFEELGKKTGAFRVTTSEDPAVFDTENLRKYDAVCFLSTTGNAFAPHKKKWDQMEAGARENAMKEVARRKENLMKFIKMGGGFVGIHAATDTFYEWEEYGRMMNGFFDGHPWSAQKFVSVKVEPGRENHPLVSMFEGKNLEFPEEIYQFKAPYESKSVGMLLRLDVQKTDMNVGGIKRKDGDFGIAWYRSWGKGRVFYCSLGHNHEIYWHPAIVRHYLAGTQWALGDLKVD